MDNVSKAACTRLKWKKDVSKFDEEFIKNSDEGSDKGYILKVDVSYSKHLLNIHGDLPFLGDRKKIKKCNKFVCNTNDKENYVVHIRTLKHALNHGLILRKLNTAIQFNQESWLKEYTDMHQYKINNRSKKWFFQINEQFCFWKDNEKCEKAQRF